MIDFKGKIGLIHKVSSAGTVDNCIAPANDRKTGVDSIACKGTVGDMTGLGTGLKPGSFSGDIDSDLVGDMTGLGTGLKL